MLKFFIVLISLLLFLFGLVFTIGLNDKDGINKIKEKTGYDSLSIADQIRVDERITKLRNKAFISTIFGICMFIASLFL